MAAKLLHSLAEDNSDLQKQIGCMTGIFQLFDHQHILTGKRTAHKRLLLGNSRSESGNSRRENSITHHGVNVKGSTGNKSVDEGQRMITESSGASFSSSCSSSFSSMEFNRASLPEASSFDRILFSRTPSKGLDSLDLRDIVKECMYREARTLPIKSNEEKTVINLSKHRDSSRSSQSKDGSSEVAINAKKNTIRDLDKSLKVLAELRDVPWYYNEAKQLEMSSCKAKDGTRHSGSRNVPRFSYEEKDRNRLSFEAIKSAPKQKELPRLSLDSREGSMKSIPSHLSRNLQSNGFSNEKVPQKRVPGVVAKLMGLEALPHSSLTSSTTSNKASLIRTHETVEFPTNPVEVPTSLQRESADRMMKPIQSSKLPLDIAPWSQFDGNQGSSKPSLRADSSSSVYSEIEKRLKNIEFKQSGKDLRALKQILEAIESKGLLRPEAKGGSDMIFQKDYEPNSSPRQINGVILHRNKRSNTVMGSTTHEPYSSSVLESQIVGMKPASLMGKSNISASSVIQKGSHQRLSDVKKSASNRVLKDQTPRNSIRDSSSSTSGEKRPKMRNVTLPQPSSKSQQFGLESTLGSVKISGSLSPRLQQKKPEPENRLRPPTPPDSDKPRRTSNGRAKTLSSPSGTSRHKSCSLLQSDDQLSEISNASRSLSYMGDEISLLFSDNNLSAYSKMNTKSTGRILSTEYVPSRSMKKNPNLRCDEDESQIIISPEHPSPVSVLDPSAYRDDELSPVKKISNTFEGDHNLDGDNFFVEDQWRSLDDLLPQSMTSVPINHQKLQNIDNLVQKLGGLNSHHDGKTDYIILLCENTNPDFRYISQILLASGLLFRDLSSSMKTFRLHPSGHPINPELFFVLEQTKASRLSSKGNNLLGVAEKSHRKLIFDVVNELLAQKLRPISLSSELVLKPNRVGSETLSAQNLMKKLCCEIEQLSAKSLDEEDDGLKNFLRVDLMNGEENWTDFYNEISGAVLDIERSIFKNLVDEIVASEGAYLRAKSGRQMLA